MSETLEERLRHNAHLDEFDMCLTRVYAGDVIELLDARDKTIAEQRAVIAELSEEPITEFETLRQAHDAQNEVLRKKQAELDAVRYAAHMPDDYKFGLASWVNQTLYACYIGAAISPHVSRMIEAGQLVFPNAPAWKELDALRAENDALCDALRKTQAELASAKLGIQ